MSPATPGKPRRPGSVRSDFEAALERLVSGKPNDKTLRERAAKKTLRITIATLALEAGRSRTLIGSDDCRYPDIRAKVEELNSRQDAPVTTVTKLAESLRATNARLRAELTAARAQQALLMVRMIEAERAAGLATRRMEDVTNPADAEAGNVVAIGPRRGGPKSRRGR